MNISAKNFGIYAKIAFGALLVSGLAMGLSACGGTPKGQSKYEIASDIPLGSKDAKVVIVEYASVMCPHCANFQENVMPKVLSEFVDKGVARYVFREFPTPPIELASAGHLLLRCVAPEKREALITALMSQQQNIYTQAQSGAAKEALITVASSAGINETQFDTCLKDMKKQQILVDVKKYGIEVDNVSATPTVFVNGKLVESPIGREYSFEDIAKAVKEAQEKSK